MPVSWLLCGRYDMHAFLSIDREAPKGEGDRHSLETVSYNKLLVTGVNVDSEGQTVVNFSLAGSVHDKTGGREGCLHNRTMLTLGVVSEGLTFHGRSHFGAQEKTKCWPPLLFLTCSFILKGVCFPSWNQKETAVWTGHLYNFPSPAEIELKSAKYLGKPCLKKKKKHIS